MADGKIANGFLFLRDSPDSGCAVSFIGNKTHNFALFPSNVPYYAVRSGCSGKGFCNLVSGLICSKNNTELCAVFLNPINPISDLFRICCDLTFYLVGFDKSPVRSGIIMFAFLTTVGGGFIGTDRECGYSLLGMKKKFTTQLSHQGN
ncbi:MAG: hypothetical protein OXE85_14735 [Roseovarius sp.]|nr:hypothetical protein [Roseovarius sp.]